MKVKFLCAGLCFLAGFIAAFGLSKNLERYSNLEIRASRGPVVCEEPVTIECMTERARSRCMHGRIDQCQQVYQLSHNPDDRWLTIEFGEKVCREEGESNLECHDVYSSLLDLTSEAQADRFAEFMCDNNNWAFGCRRKLVKAARSGASEYDLLSLTEQYCHSSGTEPAYDRVCEKIRKAKSVLSWNDLKNIKVELYYKFDDWNGVVQQTFWQSLFPPRSPAAN